MDRQGRNSLCPRRGGEGTRKRSYEAASTPCVAGLRFPQRRGNAQRARTHLILPASRVKVRDNTTQTQHTHTRASHVPVLEKAGAVACSCTGTSTISIAAHHISISILQPIKVIVGELRVVFPVSSKMVSESFLDRMLTLVARSLTGRYRSLLVVLVAYQYSFTE